MQSKTNNKKKPRFFILVWAVPLIVFCLYAIYQHYVSGLPYYGQGRIPAKQAPYSSVPGFSFTNQEGKTVDSSTVDNKIWVADFFFTSCPSICPKMTAHLKEVQAAFKNADDLRILSFTVDPERDNAEKLAKYADMHGIDANSWSLLTGSKRDLYRYARHGLFVDATDGDGGAEDFIHSDRLVLIDRNGHIRGYYDGTSDIDTKLLIADIKTLL